MTISQAQTSIKRLNAELFNLTPSSIVELFEIDISNLYSDQYNTSDYSTKIFRFHSNLKLNNIGNKSNNILWRSNVYHAVAIQAKGFEFNSKGSIAAPTLSIVIGDENIPKLIELKTALRLLGDLTGGIVRRYRTFAKFLDAENWDINGLPNGFIPDPNSYLTEDVYYIDRKTADNKNVLEYELTSLANLEGVKLPNRLVLSDRCPFTYRGEGCLYEYYDSSDSHFQRKNAIEHSGAETIEFTAPPVGTRLDEKFADILAKISSTNQIRLSDKGEFSTENPYKVGDVFYISKDYINYYFLVKANTPSPPPFPPNSFYYIQDDCSKSLKGCRLRYQTINGGILPYGGFAAASRVTEN
jgi:lambda family phage minor tail protein L